MSDGILKIENAHLELMRLCSGNPWQDPDFSEKFDISWIYHDNALEGTVLLYHEIMSALRGDEGQNGRLFSLYQGIRNYKDVILIIRSEFMTRRTRFTLDVVRQIHSMLVKDIPGCTGGRYRKDIPLHRTYYHDISMPDKISYNMRKLGEFIASEKFNGMHPMIKASKIHFRLLSIFPFSECSGKVARLSMNLILAGAGHMPVVVHSVERQRYFESLKAPHAGSRTLLLESMANCLVNTGKYYHTTQRKNLLRSASVG